MNKCYVCGDDKELSIHARRKNSVSMICKPCRRERSKTPPVRQFRTDVIVSEEYLKQAYDSYMRISNKYARASK